MDIKDRIRESIISKAGGSLAILVGFLLIWIAKKIAPIVLPVIQQKLPADVLVSIILTSLLLNLIFLVIFWLFYKKQEFRLKYGIYWDKNKNPHCHDDGKLPSILHDSLDAIRNIGNFAAHPIKSESTGEIIEVEDGEAEWNLDVLEALFDYYFVQPTALEKKREALNKKLKEAGKPPLK